jgi:hypothetical protein
VLEPSKLLTNQLGQVFKLYLEIKIIANEELYGFWQENSPTTFGEDPKKQV